MPAFVHLFASSVHGSSNQLSVYSITIETNLTTKTSAAYGVYCASISSTGVDYSTSLYIGSKAYRVKITKLEKVY